MSGKFDYPLERNFSYHPPKPGQPEIYEALRDHAKRFSALILHHCPESRERSIALTKIEESIMWANASIARDGE